MSIKYDKLLKLYSQVGVEQARAILKGWFQEGHVKPGELDLGKLFCEAYGWNAFNSCRSEKHLATTVMEAAGGVTTAAFTDISGQFIFSATMEAFENEAFVFSGLIPEMQSITIGVEKIPQITEIGDESLVVKEGDPYPLAGVASDYIEAPEAEKRGKIVPLTREAIFNDKTGQLLERCRKVGYWLGVNKEKRVTDCVIDEGAGASSLPTTHRNKRRGNVIATYADNSGNHDFDNLSASTGLVDWTDVDSLEQLFNSITDSNTGEPVMVDPKHLIVTKQNENVARRIINATEITVVTAGYATSGNPTETKMANPYANRYQIITSRLLAARMATDTNWFLGDLTKAFKYKVIWPLEVTEAPTNSEVEFSQDIVKRFKASEFGAPFTVEPRAMCKATA